MSSVLGATLGALWPVRNVVKMVATKGPPEKEVNEKGKRKGACMFRFATLLFYLLSPLP